jgi:GNAT superfamily N-acetyltransferase
MSIIVREATTPADFAAFGALIREYLDWARERHKDVVWFVEMAASHQDLNKELAALPYPYDAPNGVILLADDGGEIKGCVAYKRLGESVCEMKRMFVPARFHGQGAGRKLCQALIARARDDGYALMRLDTAQRFTEAIALYRSVGFAACAPYIEYPARMDGMMVFMDLPLGAQA